MERESNDDTDDQVHYDAPLCRHVTGRAATGAARAGILKRARERARMTRPYKGGAN